MKASRTSSSPLLPFAMLVLTLILAALDQTILSTALPVIARELRGSWPLAWVFSAYLLAATVVIALYGRLADVLGKKPMLLLAIGLFLAGSLACGASQDVQQLVLARALQGAGGGGLMTLTMLTVPDLFAPEQRGRYQALLGAAYGVSTMFGPLLGGALVEHLSWHWAFWMNVPAAALAWGVLASTLPSKPMAAQASAAEEGRQRTRIDWLGAVLLTAALVLLLLATQHGQLNLPEAVSLWLLLGLGAKFALAFIWRQKRAAQPLLPLSLFARPAYAAVSFIGMATGIALYAAVVFLPQYLQIGLHLSPTGSAWHLLPLMAGITVAAVTSGKLLRAQRPAISVARVACVLMLLSFGLMIGVLRWLPAEPLALSAALLPLGLGLGLLFPIVTVVAQRVSPAQHMGIATAAPIMLRSLGGAAGVALLAALLTRLVKQELTTPGALAHGAADAVTAALGHGLQSVFGCAAVAVLLALIASSWLVQKRPPEGLANDGLLEAAS
ncbi:MFS transporter [Variovorax paradoxus]|uniref:MFS transporter n=1 Tax=Variovorax paradoxus TaxID=34073 RepID=UPI00278449B4|nr:MFS transporter [Variovorax paradoxus]MDP9932518.1 EmrB/QacA subfamily drug resistance transporter [Variovorax paradoxus]